MIKTAYWRCGEAMKGESYQKFMPWQQGDFGEKMQDLNWWRTLLWPFAFAGLCCYLGWLWLADKLAERKGK